MLQFEVIMKYVDLHTHTHISDGTDSPKELVQKAASLGLAAIAITDHDTVAGLPEAEEEGKKLGLEVVRGCELSVESERGEVHILGLWIDQDATELEKTLTFLRQKRQERNAIIVERLQNAGLKIDLEDVNAVAQGETVGRPHIAVALMHKGYVSSVREAFNRYLGTKGKAYAMRELLPMEEAMQALKKAHAIISLAHPGLISCEDAWLDSYVGKLCEHGLDAIETYHSEHPPATRQRCLDLAQKYNLLISGGSDYHGHVKPHIHLGVGKGDLRIPLDIMQKLKAKHLEQKN